MKFDLIIIVLGIILGGILAIALVAQNKNPRLANDYYGAAPCATQTGLFVPASWLEETQRQRDSLFRQAVAWRDSTTKYQGRK